MNTSQNIFQLLYSIPKNIKKATLDLIDSWHYIYYMTHVSYAPIKAKSVRLK